jgi:3-methyladenine DNA glycosylase AlkD
MTEMKSGDVESIRKQLDRKVEKLPVRNVPSVRAIRREYSKKLANWPAADMFNLVESLIAVPSWPRRLIGFELLANHRQAFSRLNDKRIDRLTKGLSDWGSIDLFGCSLAGPAWRDGLVSDQQVEKWMSSRDHWQRRLALVSTVALSRSARVEPANAAKVLFVCRRLVTDREDMVVKALSWALRELAKSSRHAAQTFLEENKPDLAARIVRELNNKLTTGLKTPKSRGAVGRSSRQ